MSEFMFMFAPLRSHIQTEYSCPGQSRLDQSWAGINMTSDIRFSKSSDSDSDTDLNKFENHGFLF